MSDKTKDIMPWRQFLQMVGAIFIAGFILAAGSKMANRIIPDKPNAPLVVIHKVEE